MEFSIEQLALMLGGEVQGDASQKVWRLDKIQEGKEGGIAFLANMKYEPHLYTTQASVVIVDRTFEPKQAVNTTLIKVDDAYTSFSKLLTEYQKLKNQSKQGIEQPSYIADDAVIGQDVYIAAFVYIGSGTVIKDNVKIYPHSYIGDNVQVGKDTTIYAGAKVYNDTQIGASCTLHAGCVIGSDGFGFAPQSEGNYETIPQIGNVILEDHVSIGANTVVDCATMGSTIIQQGAKLDNLVQVAHNVVIGRHTVIAAQAGVSGSTEIGDQCMIGGQVGFAGHIKIAHKTMIGAQSGIGKSIKKEGTIIQGSPAFDMKDWYKSSAIFRKLPQMDKQLFQIKKILDSIQEEKD